MSENIITNEIKSKLINLEDLKDYEIFLFGSRAKGNFKLLSDYDIGIYGKKKLELSKFLGIKRLLDDLPYSIDFVDFNRVDKDFRDLAYKDRTIWK